MRDMTLILRQHLKGHDWVACSDLISQDSQLVGASDADGFSLLSYAARDARWLEAQWLLKNGWSWEDVRKTCSQYVVDLSTVPTSWIDDLTSNAHEVDGRWCLLLSLIRSQFITEALDYIKVANLKSNDWALFWAEYANDFIEDDASEIWLAGDAVGGVNTDALLQVALAGVRKNRWDMLGWAYGLGLDIEKLDSSGDSLLGVAVKMNRMDMLDWIVGAGTSVDMFDGKGHTALYVAVASGRLDCIKFLVDSGAKSDLRQGRNGQGNSPLRLAQKSTRSAVRSKVVQDFEFEILNRTTGCALLASSGARSKRL